MLLTSYRKVNLWGNDFLWATLFDDWPPYFIPWLKHRPRGVVVFVAQPWNANMNEIMEQAHAVGIGNLHEKAHILRYDGTNLEELKAQLRWAYNRPARGE